MFKAAIGITMAECTRPRRYRPHTQTQKENARAFLFLVIIPPFTTFITSAKKKKQK